MGLEKEEEDRKDTKRKQSLEKSQVEKRRLLIFLLNVVLSAAM